MTAARGTDERVVLPRWRQWKVSQRNRELRSLRLGISAFDQIAETEDITLELDRRLQEFNENPGPHYAADLVGTALVLGLEHSDHIRSAAESLRNSTKASMRELANYVIDEPYRINNALPSPSITVEDDWRQVARLKKIVRNQPRNALSWIDLALAQTVVGNSDAAERGIHVALNLSKDNRFVLRSAARFYVVREDLSKARFILSRDKNLLINDPWLLAAEIAIADLQRRPSKFIASGRRCLERDFSPLDRSELASALAKLELSAGRTRAARRLLADALIDPTDNSLAQAEWSVDHGVDMVEPELLGIARGFEARALYHYRTSQFDAAVREGQLWQADQPFALDPAFFVSYTAATFANNWGVAISSCETGLRTNPRNTLLINNLAFALACAGRSAEAREVLRRSKTPPTPAEAAMITATEGLIEFREGDDAMGRQLYKAAISQLISNNQKNHAARAALFWAYEEHLTAGAGIREASEMAQRLGALRSSDNEVRMVRLRLEDLMARRLDGGTRSS